jgi:hypothetical protein
MRAALSSPENLVGGRSSPRRRTTSCHWSNSVEPSERLSFASSATPQPPLEVSSSTESSTRIFISSSTESSRGKKIQIASSPLLISS